MVNFTPPSELSKIQTTFSDDSLIVISVYNSNTRKYESTCSVKYSDFIKHFVHAENGDSNDDHLKITRSITISSVDNDKNKIKITLKDKDGNTIAETNEYSFGVGSVVKSAKYENKHLTIEFDEGIDPIDIDMEELVSDLQHKLDAVNGITISDDYKIGHSNSVTPTQEDTDLYKIAHDAQGHITDSVPVTKNDITALGIPGQDTTYSAGAGLTLEGTQIRHSGSIQAQQTAVFKKIAYNGTGHITAISDVTYGDMPSELQTKISTLESNKVDKSTTVNNKNLGSNITLDGSDIKLTGYEKPQETGTIASTDTINEAIGKLEKGSYWVKKTIDLTGWDENYWFPVTGTPLANGANNHILVDVQLNSGSHPNWSTHDRGYTVILDMIVTAAGWGTTYGNSICLQHSARFVENEQEPPVSYWQLTKSSTPVLWCRGGGKYFVWTNYECNWIPHNYPGITIEGETVVPTTIYPNLSFAKSTIIANIRSDSIEFTGSNYPGISTVHGGFIDFHFAEDPIDYTSRIAEYERGVLTIGAKNTSGVEVGGAIRTIKDPSNDNDLTRRQYVDRGTTYYHCETTANNPSKVIETTDGSWYDESEWANQINNRGEKFIYKPGRRITIQFSGQNTAENPTLNVHDLGAKPIYYRNAPISGHDLSLLAGVCEFVYDGAEWLLVGNNHKQVIPANSYQGLYTITYDSEGHITSAGQPNAIELIGNDTVGDIHGGYIDFHYAKEGVPGGTDYTSRIIEEKKGILRVEGSGGGKLETDALLWNWGRAHNTYTTSLAEEARGVLRIRANSGSEENSGEGGEIYTAKDPQGSDSLTRRGWVEENIQNGRLSNYTKSGVDVITSPITTADSITNAISRLEKSIENLNNIASSLYPVGSIYLDASNSNTCPVAALIPGSTWSRLTCTLENLNNVNMSVVSDGNAIVFKTYTNNQDTNIHNNYHSGRNSLHCGSVTSNDPFKFGATTGLKVNTSGTYTTYTAWQRIS